MPLSVAGPAPGRRRYVVCCCHAWGGRRAAQRPILPQPVARNRTVRLQRDQRPQGEPVGVQAEARDHPGGDAGHDRGVPELLAGVRVGEVHLHQRRGELGAGVAGVQSTSFVNWITLPSRFWTIGPQLAQTLFDAGRRRARLGEVQANYDAVAANYRQTVLTAFQQVEDNLAALRILAEESAVLQQSVKSAERSVTISTAQYKGGIASYLQVITVQAILLQTQRTAIDVQTRRMTASTLLIECPGAAAGMFRSCLPFRTCPPSKVTNAPEPIGSHLLEDQAG